MSGRLAALLLAGLALAGCTSSGGGPSSAPATPPVTSVATTPAPSSSAATTAAPPSTATSSTAPTRTRSSSSPAPSTSASTTAPPPTRTTPPATSTACTAAQLTVSSVRGGASQGSEFAGLIFTNVSARTCTLRGYPSAQLLRAGQPLGKPAEQQSGTTPLTVRLRPGAAAQAQLTAVSTCQSQLSDHVRARAPGTGRASVVAIELRGCALTIGPVELS